MRTADVPHAPSRPSSAAARIGRVTGKALRRTVRQRVGCPKKLSRTAILRAVDPDAVNIVRDHMTHHCAHCTERAYQLVERIAADDAFHTVVGAATHTKLLPGWVGIMAGEGLEILAALTSAANLVSILASSQ
eukprot:jgi/Tetstr1/454060/TSEL_040979.t1